MMLLYALGKRREVIYLERCIYDKHICSLDLHKKAAELDYQRYKLLVVLQHTGTLHRFLRQLVYSQLKEMMEKLNLNPDGMHILEIFIFKGHLHLPLRFDICICIVHVKFYVFYITVLPPRNLRGR